MITVFADKYLYKIDECLPEEAELHLFDPDAGIPEPDILEGAEALLIRTVNRIDKETVKRLPDSIRFLATASAGFDHMDKNALKERDITFAHAPGCNARSVGEYVITALLLWADEKEIDIKEKTVGIVGVGHTGTEVLALLDRMGIPSVCYDPPRQQRDPDFKTADLAELLACDILTFHTPLTRVGSHPTRHWLDAGKLAGRSFDLIVNAARGGVVDEQALLESRYAGGIGDYILDVWENEPVFNDEVAKHAFIKTPHIAGYSKQAKIGASKMVADALCKHFGLDATDPAQSETTSINFSDHNNSLSRILTSIHPIRKYERELILLIGLEAEKKSAGFNRLRAEFPLRDEFEHVKIPEDLIDSFPILSKLGFG